MRELFNFKNLGVRFRPADETAKLTILLIGCMACISAGLFAADIIGGGIISAIF